MSTTESRPIRYVFMAEPTEEPLNPRRMIQFTAEDDIDGRGLLPPREIPRIIAISREKPRRLRFT